MKKVIFISILLLTFYYLGCSNSGKNMKQEIIRAKVEDYGMTPGHVLCLAKILNLIEHDDLYDVKIKILKVKERGSASADISSGDELELVISKSMIIKNHIKKNQNYQLELSSQEVPMQDKINWYIVIIN